MAATSPLTSPAADAPVAPDGGRHQAPGTAGRSWQAGRHRGTGRGRLAHPVVVSRVSRVAAPTAGGRPAPLAGGGRHRASDQPLCTAEPVLTLAGGGRHRTLNRTGAAGGAARDRAPAARPAVRAAAVLSLAAVLLPLSTADADAAPRPATAQTAAVQAGAVQAGTVQAGTTRAAAQAAAASAAGGPLADLPNAPTTTPAPAEPADLRWPTVGVAMALLVGISVTGSTALLLLRPARRTATRR
ncbi:MAG: hypothetical protein V7637_220 [Mycobacteriales bacterium]